MCACAFVCVRVRGWVSGGCFDMYMRALSMLVCAPLFTCTCLCVDVLFVGVYT